MAKKFLKIKKPSAPEGKHSSEDLVKTADTKDLEEKSSEDTATKSAKNSIEVADQKHIRAIRESEDSIIIEFGKTEAITLGGGSDDDEEEEYGKEKNSFGSPFLKRCVSSEIEDERQRSFKASIDIESSPTEAIYEGNRIVDYQDVVFRGYASTNESVTKGDRIGDYLRKGAFKKTIKEFKKNPVMLIDHENSTRNIAGSYTEIYEDGKGLYVEGKISNAPELTTIRTLVAEGHLKTLSIGGMFYYEDDGKGISQVDLMEISLVAIPMNPDARFEVVS